MLYRDTEELAENKLLLLYIMKETGIPLAKSEITRIVLENDFMNYFALQQFLAELVEGDFVTCYEDHSRHYYRLEEKGLNTLNLFVNRIPQKLRQTVLKYISKNMEQIKKEKQIIGRYTMQSEEEYLVNLKIIENQKVFVDISIRTDSHIHARKMCENWNSNASSLYGKILGLLLQEES